MAFVVAVCGTCAEERYRSTRDYGPTERMQPEDFVPVNGAPPASAGPAVCHKCGAQLTFGAVRDAGDPQSRPARPHLERPPVVADGGGVRTIFAAAQGEEVKSMRELPHDRILITTSKRIVIVDVAALATEVPDAR